MSYDGEWRISIQTPIGLQVVLLSLAEEAGRVTGSATQGAETVSMLDVALDGDRLRWSQTVTRPMRLSISFDVTREGDRLSGTAKPGILPKVRVEGQRLEPSS